MTIVCPQTTRHAAVLGHQGRGTRTRRPRATVQVRQQWRQTRERERVPRRLRKRQTLTSPTDAVEVNQKSRALRLPGATTLGTIKGKHPCKPEPALRPHLTVGIESHRPTTGFTALGGRSRQMAAGQAVRPAAAWPAFRRDASGPCACFRARERRRALR